jgi:AraC-like DNA-binding protein
LSTDDYPSRDRVEAWREIIGRTILRLNLEPLRPKAFRAMAIGFRSAGLGVLFATTSAVCQANSRELISSEEVSFGIAESSRWRVAQSGRKSSPGAGDGVLLRNDEIGSVSFAEKTSYVAFSVPLEAIKPRVADFDAALVRPIPASTPAMRLLGGYLDVVRKLPSEVDVVAQRVIETHVYDLLALAVGAKRDDAELAGQRGLRAAQLHAIKADAAKNLRKSFSVATLAAAHHISARHLQRLFEEEGTTFSEFLLRERLAFAHRTLRNLANARRPISAIALEAGFNDLSYFNRAFRRRFGATPSDVRATLGGGT